MSEQAENHKSITNDKDQTSQEVLVTRVELETLVARVELLEEALHSLIKK